MPRSTEHATWGLVLHACAIVACVWLFCIGVYLLKGAVDQMLVVHEAMTLLDEEPGGE